MCKGRIRARDLVGEQHTQIVEIGFERVELGHSRGGETNLFEVGHLFEYVVSIRCAKAVGDIVILVFEVDEEADARLRADSREQLGDGVLVVNGALQQQPQVGVHSLDDHWPGCMV